MPMSEAITISPEHFNMMIDALRVEALASLNPRRGKLMNLACKLDRALVNAKFDGHQSITIILQED